MLTEKKNWYQVTVHTLFKNRTEALMKKTKFRNLYLTRSHKASNSRRDRKDGIWIASLKIFINPIQAGGGDTLCPPTGFFFAVMKRLTVG